MKSIIVMMTFFCLNGFSLGDDEYNNDDYFSALDSGAFSYNGNDNYEIDVPCDFIPQDEALTKLKESNTRYGNFSGADFRGLDLSYIDFSGADLQGTNFTGCKLIGTIFQNAKLNNAQFDGATLTKTKFSLADLKGASFINSEISEANFGPISNADVEGAIFIWPEDKKDDLKFEIWL